MGRAARPLILAVLLVSPALAAGQGTPPLPLAPSPFPVGVQKGKPDEDPDGKKDQKKEANGEKKEGEKKNGNGEKDDKKDDKDEKDKDKKDDEDKGPQWWSIHGQATTVMQGNWKFRAPYSGPNSLPDLLNYRTTQTATLYLDARLVPNGELIFNPEVSGGQGIGHTIGLAGFPNGEATRIGAIAPTPYIGRLFWRHTIGLGGEREEVADGPNQLAGSRDVSRLTFRVGKMAANDIFDDNAYSHDPRNQFLNWSLMDNGAWDYPANTRGYDYGITAELNQKDWAFRYGIFGEPTVANGADIDPRFLRANGQVAELEMRYRLLGRPGKIRLLSYLNNAHMGSFREALELNPQHPDITQTRAYRTKYGFGLNFEQELTDDVGAFSRIGWADGHTENWAFTQIDRTISAGLLCKGTAWGRKADTLGAAVVFNGLSPLQRAYLAAGGVGFIIGDGRLRYGPEEILELFYTWRPKEFVGITLDFQGVNNPAYNRDRGPVAIAALRVHFEY